MSSFLLGLLIFGTSLVTVAALVVVHELGHYVAGITVGIPANAMRLRVLSFPQHVALKDGDSWVTPLDYQRYLDIAKRHLKSPLVAGIYIAGGFVVETCVLSAVVLNLPGKSIFPITVAGVALVTTIIYTGVDALQAFKKGHPAGDFSALWLLSRKSACSLVLFVFLIQSVLVVHSLRGI